MKKLLLGVGLLLVAGFARAVSPGLTNITVERYYVTNAADSVWATSNGSSNATQYIANGGVFHTNMVTYRVYATVAAGYKVYQVYGNASHPLKVQTSTDFFNTDDGSYFPFYSNTNLPKKGLGMIDSWFTIGNATADGYYGILKKDQSGSNGITATTAGILRNNLPAMGFALTAEGGISGTKVTNVTPVGAVGDMGSLLGIFQDGSTVANNFTDANGSYSTAGGQPGLGTDSNKVLIGQFTTNGTFTYQFNIQISNGTTTYNYVPSGASAVGEYNFAALAGSIAPLTMPTVSVTGPTSGQNIINGKTISLSANAAQANGSVASVQFYVDGTAVGTAVTSSPYKTNYVASTNGSHTVTAVVTDNLGSTTTSAGVNFTVNPPTAPSVSISAPTTGTSVVAGKLVRMTAAASDIDTTISKIVFYVDGAKVDSTTFAQVNGVYTETATSKLYAATTGSHTLTAKAFDRFGLSSTSAGVSLTGTAQVNPTISLTAPTAGATSVQPDAVTLTASASSADTTVSSVQFYVDGTAVGSVVTSSPYTTTYAGVTGNHSVTAVATDAFGHTSTSSAVSIVVNAPIAPVVSITSPAAGGSYLPIDTAHTPAINFSVNTSDADATVTSVQYYVNGVAVGAPVTSGSPSFPYTWASAYNAGTNGVATITAVATDSRGLSTTSAAVSITIVNPHSAYSIVSTVNACTVPQVSQTVKAIISASNVIGYDFVMNYDKTKLAYNAIQVNRGLIADSTMVTAYVHDSAAAGQLTVTLALNGGAPAGTSFNGLGNLFTVVFDKTAGFQPKDKAAFSIPTLTESYYTGTGIKSVQAGVYTSYADSIFAGSLKYYNNNQPMKSGGLATNIYGNNAQSFTCGSVSSTAVSPDATGIFNFTINNGWSMIFSRDINNSTDLGVSGDNVLNAADATILQQVLIGNYHATALQLVAMDVNLDGQVSAGDLSQLNQRIVKKIGEFVQKGYYNNQGVSLGNGPSKDWLFVDSVSLTTAPFTTGFSKSNVPAVPTCLPVHGTTLNACPVFTPESYTGVMVGDIDGSWATYANGTATPTAKLNNANEALVLDLGNAVVNGNFVDVPVSILSAEKVTGIDFATQLDENNLSFNTVVDNNKSSEALAYYNEQDKMLRFTASTVENYVAGTQLFTVRLAANNGTVTPEQFTNAVAAFNGKKVAVSINAAGLQMNADLKVNVYPNPATSVLNVTATERATVQLFDMAGKLVAPAMVINANENTVLNTAALAAGVYTMKISNDNFVATKRIVINN